MLTKYHEVENLRNDAISFATNSLSSNTRRKYETHIKQFIMWCNERNIKYFENSIDAVILYITSISNKSISNLQQCIAAIGYFYDLHELDNPCKSKKFKLVYKGIKNKVGIYQKGKDPLLLDDVYQIISCIPNTLTGIRDKALLLIGFFGALRRSEIVNIDINDITFNENGILIRIKKSKVDQESKGEVVAIPSNDAVYALIEWLDKSKIIEGNIFRSIDRYNNIGDSLTDWSVAYIIKKYAKKANIEKDISGHSLRSGLVTEAARNKAPINMIMSQTRHKSINMVMRYIKESSLFEYNVVNYIK